MAFVVCSHAGEHNLTSSESCPFCTPSHPEGGVDATALPPYGAVTFLFRALFLPVLCRARGREQTCTHHSSYGEAREQVNWRVNKPY